MENINDKIFNAPVIKFEEYEYVRPELEDYKDKYQSQIDKLKEAKTADEALDTFRKLQSYLAEYESYYTLASIRNSVNTKDEFYEKEMEYISETAPQLEEYLVEFKKALLESPHRKILEDKLGSYLFKQYESDLTTFSPEIIEDLAEENKLIIEHSKLISSCEKEYKGEKLNLTGLAKYTRSENRQERIDAQKLINEFFEENEEKIDEIYDKLVKVRHRQAQKLGYENYIPLRYKQMGRFDYDKNDVANYRKQILEEIVPLAQDLIERQKKRIGIDDFNFVDESLQFKSGNAKPHGDKEWMLERARKMYKELSPETDTFFKFMEERNLFDLDVKPGKSGGGYCTYIPKWRSPFIFANFNGTSHDVEVLTHEAGHAFQVFNSRDFGVLEYIWPGMESAEIHSMSMEFFTWPWMELFFEDEVEKFKFQHLQGALLFLPYGALIDHFQHYVYENPDATPKMRKEKFRELEKMYLPHRVYKDLRLLDDGGYFFKQSHVFSSAFYYIDYTIAQVLAFQFWNKDRQNHEEAFQDYLRLCKAGGTKSFLQLVETANLENPFKDGVIKKTVEHIKEYLNNVDDSKF